MRSLTSTNLADELAILLIFINNEHFVNAVKSYCMWTNVSADAINRA